MEEKLVTSIENVISQVSSLETKDGKHYTGKCKCGSDLFIDSEKQQYYCFSCGKGGNVINFVMDYFNYSYNQALEYLGIEEKVSGIESNYHKTLMKMNKDAAIFYYKMLRKYFGKDGLKYYKEERKLSDETIKKFGLGFAPYAKHMLYDELKNKGYKDDDIKKSGLVTFYDDGGIRDKFRNRVIVPIMNEYGQVIAFGGRVLDDSKPKYLNSSDTETFNKSITLFAFKNAKESKRKGLIICEGYLDVISMHQEGFDNMVASLGTAFTPYHAKMIKQYTNDVLLAYDMDEPGRMATVRAINILKNVGITPKTVDMSPCKDPDEFIKKFGKEKFEERIQKAITADEFLLKRYSKMDDEKSINDFLDILIRPL